MKGHSLVEVIVATFILTSLLIAAFAVFGSGVRASVKIDHLMIATRLAQKKCEELHTYKSAEIQSTQATPFDSPFNQYYYSVSPVTYWDADPLIQDSSQLVAMQESVEQINVMVQGPLEPGGQPTLQTCTVNLSMLLARQPYP